MDKGDIDMLKIKSILTQVLENINKKCLSFFKDENVGGVLKEDVNKIKMSISHTLAGIKKFMLLEQGDFLN